MESGMNDNNDPNSNVAFNTNPDTQASTNPFTGDLKGEFSSDFGTNTNAVSQIFKNSNFSSENRTKYVAIGAVVVLALSAIAFVMTDPGADPFDDEFADEMAEEDAFPEDAEDLDELDAAAGESEAEKDDVKTAEGDEKEMAEDMQADSEKDVAPEEGMQADAEEATEMAETMPQSTGDFTLVSPQTGARRPYDETMAPAEFSWEGSADRINFSRSSTMVPLEKSVPLNGASFYALENPYPGTWYWQVVNADGRAKCVCSEC